MNLGNFYLATEILTCFWRRAYTFLSSRLDQNPKVLKDLWLIVPCPAISHFKKEKLRVWEKLHKLPKILQRVHGTSTPMFPVCSFPVHTLFTARPVPVLTSLQFLQGDNTCVQTKSQTTLTDEQETWPGVPWEFKTGRKIFLPIWV